jgi:hypothetical protein
MDKPPHDQKNSEQMARKRMRTNAHKALQPRLQALNATSHGRDLHTDRLMLVQRLEEAER